jgi:hypothetical protein
MRKLLSKSSPTINYPFKNSKGIIAKGLLCVKNNCVQALASPVVAVIIFVQSNPSLAQTISCPTPSKETREVTVKDDNATLRTEPKYSKNNKGPSIGKNDKLVVILFEPKLGPDKNKNIHCWYKVSILNDQDKKIYWIADIGLVEFPSWSNTPSPTPTPSVSPTPGDTSPHQSEKEPSVPWMVWVLAPIGIIVVGLFAYAYDRIKRRGYFNNRSSNSVKTDNLSSSNPDTTIIKTDEDTPSVEQPDKDILSLNQSAHITALMTQKMVKLLEKNGKQDENVKQDLVKEVNELKVKVTKQDREIGELKAEISELKAEKDREISELKSTINDQDSKISKILESDKQEIDKIRQDVSQNADKVSEPNPELQQQLLNRGDSAQFFLPKELQRLVDEFNNDNKDYFLNLDRHFLTESGKSVHRQPSMDDNTNLVVELVDSEDSQAFYFKIKVDKENWLFPNLNSSYFQKIMNGLNPSIFNVNPNSDTLKKLVKPAKLENAGSGIWEIAERGEFI